MIRNYSNRTARGRLNSDMSERGRYDPRGMLLITAEEQTALESTLARLCIIEVTEGAIDRDKLSAIQRESEKLPLAMASYIHWLRENMEEIKTTFPARFRELRERAANEGFHKKLPEQAAFMGFTLQCVTSFFLKKVLSPKTPPPRFLLKAGIYSSYYQNNSNSALKMITRFSSFLKSYQYC